MSRLLNSLSLLRALKQRWCALMDERDGAVALESALVLPLYVYFTLFLFQLSLLFFWQEVLDYATASAARAIQVGSAQTQASTSAGFVQAVLCPNLNGLIACSQVLVTVSTVSDFYGTANYSIPKQQDGTVDPSKMPFCNGAPGQLMLIRSIYSTPLSLWPMTSNGNSIIVSTAAFQNEAFPATGAANGC